MKNEDPEKEGNNYLYGYQGEPSGGGDTVQNFE